MATLYIRVGNLINETIWCLHTYIRFVGYTKYSGWQVELVVQIAAEFLMLYHGSCKYRSRIHHCRNGIN